MKRIIAILLMFAITLSTLSFTSCGNSAYNEAKAAYESIAVANDIILDMGDDICSANEMGLHEKSSLFRNGIDAMITSKEYDINLSRSELTEGAARMMSYFLGYDWNSLTDTEKDTCRENVYLFGYLFEDDLQEACVTAVLTSYKMNGTIDAAAAVLGDARLQIDTISEKYPNYEHNAALKNYYDAVANYLAFCKMPFDGLDYLSYVTARYRSEIDKAELALSGVFEN